MIFNDFDTQTQSDELVDDRISDEDLLAAAEFYDELDFELMEDDLNLYSDDETRLADEDWNEHREELNIELLDESGDFNDYDE